jgi:hypothetical protein
MTNSRLNDGPGAIIPLSDEAFGRVCLVIESAPFRDTPIPRTKARLAVKPHRQEPKRRAGLLGRRPSGEPDSGYSRNNAAWKGSGHSL